MELRSASYFYFYPLFFQRDFRQWRLKIQLQYNINVVAYHLREVIGVRERERERGAGRIRMKAVGTFTCTVNLNYGYNSIRPFNWTTVLALYIHVLMENRFIVQLHYPGELAQL